MPLGSCESISNEFVAFVGTVVDFLKQLDELHQLLSGVPTINQQELEEELFMMHKVVQNLIGMMKFRIDVVQLEL